MACTRRQMGSFARTIRRRCSWQPEQSDGIDAVAKRVASPFRNEMESAEVLDCRRSVHGVRCRPRRRDPSFNCRAVSLFNRAAVAHEKLADPGVAGRVPCYRRTYGAPAHNAAALEHQLSGAGVGETFPGERTSRTAPENFARAARGQGTVRGAIAYHSGNLRACWSGKLSSGGTNRRSTRRVQPLSTPWPSWSADPRMRLISRLGEGALHPPLGQDHVGK